MANVISVTISNLHLLKIRVSIEFTVKMGQASEIKVHYPLGMFSFASSGAESELG